MPQIGFRCPDSVNVTHAACLAGCRMGSRCMTKPTLQAMSHQRSVDAPPSTTELIKGTRQAYLQRVTDYYSDPQGLAFALLGQKAHAKLEHEDSDTSILEERFKEGGITGIADCFEVEDEYGCPHCKEESC